MTVGKEEESIPHSSSFDNKMENDSDSDEEDSIDLDQENEKIIPKYKTIGKAFLLAAIVVAILVVVLPTTLIDKVQLKTDGVIFRVAFGVFMFCLFLCLLFIYSLSQSVAWEEPNLNDIHLNFTNITIIAGIIIEFIQICSFSFNSLSEFTGSEILRYFNYVAVPFAPGISFRVIYWIMFVLAFSPYIFVVTVRLILHFMNRNYGENYTSSFISKYQQKIYSVLWFLVNTMYLPVISTMFGGEDCTIKSDSDSSTATLDSDPNINCFKNIHIPFMICSLIALVMYYPAASFAQSQTQNISDIKFKPRVVFIFAQLKVILAAVTLFATTLIEFYLGAVLAVNIIFMGINIVLKPCLVNWVNRLRSVLFSLALAATVCSWIAYGGAPKIAPLILLIVSWIALAILFYLFYKFEPTLSDTLTSLGLKKNIININNNNNNNRSSKEQELNKV
ncbi:hypothetical protein ACTFIR_000268 [Dictyostelium discoideum]